MLSREQARAFYDRFGAKQDAQAFYEDRAVRALVAHSQFDTATAVFEYGCGTGRIAADLLTNHLPAGATYVGCDLSTTMIDLARQRLARFGARATLRLTDGSPRLDAADASVDRFLSTYVLDLLSPEDIRALLGEARRILTADGRLCLVSLTYGCTLLSRTLIGIWTQIHRMRPSLVGGCRPIALRDFLSESHWRIVHREVVTAFGVPSEVLVACKRTSA
jgi:ubiquinone/menaquinone biosynthesis C-methylase UbiE